MSDTSDQASPRDTDTDTGTDTGTGPGDRSSGDTPMISDDQLPDDLNPEKNPLAREPDRDGSAGGAGGDGDRPDSAAQAPGDPAVGDGPDPS